MSDTKNREFVRTLHGMIADFLRDNPDIDRSYYQEIWDWLEKKEDGENEDERMIRILKEGLKGLTVFNYTPVDEIFAWLEKKKESVMKEPGLYYYDGEKITYCGFPPIKDNPYDFAMSQEEKQKPANPFSGTCFNYNGHHYGICARDNGIEVTKDGVLIYRSVPPFISQNPVWDEERKAIFIPIINKYLDAKHSETEMTWDYAMEYAKQAGKELPSQHEMFALLLFKDEINKILNVHGGDFLNEYAWSSSETPNGMAVLANFNSGNTCFIRKTDYNYAYTVADV